MLVASAQGKPQKKRIDFKGIWQKLTSNSWVTYVFLLYVVAFLTFGYTLIRNSFVIPISGDFVIQEIPFYFNGYDDWKEAFATGHFPLWDDSAFLGVNNIGANAFYYLFNIFFLPTLLLPREIIPQVQAFLIITKIVLAGVGMRKLLEIYEVKEDTCILVGLAYAFCGWNFFYLWFNHFFEITVLMPFFLWSIEYLLRKRNPFYLIFMVALVGITNYFFLISFCFTGVLYSLFRYFQRFKIMKEMNEEAKKEHPHILHVRLEIMLKGVMSFALGLILAAFILLPCFDAVLTNPRVSDATYAGTLVESFNAFKDALKGSSFTMKVEAFKEFFGLLTDWEQAEGSAEYATKYLMYPAISFFFPNISCYDSPLFINNGYDNHQASLYVFTPLTLLLLPSLLLSLKKRKWSHFLAVGFSLVLLFTPFAYYCFSGFTTNAYGRWQIFIVCIYCIYVATSFDHKDEFVKGSMLASLILTLGIQYYLIDKAKGMQGTVSTKNLDQDREMFCYIAMIYTVIIYIIYLFGLKRKNFTKHLKFVIAFEAVIVGNIVQQVQGTTNFNTSLYGGYTNVAEEVRLANRIKEVDSSYYRVFSTSADRTGNNLAMILGTKGVGTFHSVYNYNLDEFLNWSQITYGYGGWSMGIHEKRVNLDEFLGIKYYIVKSSDHNIPFGFEEIYSTDNHSVYINNNHIELGSSYETIYNKSSMSSEWYSFTRSSSHTFMNELAYLNGAIIDDEISEKLLSEYPNFMLKVPGSDEAITSKYHKVANGTVMVERYEDNKLQEPINASENSNALKALKWNSVVEETFPSLKVCGNASRENPCYVDIQARLGENLYISLYGGENQDRFLVGDNHMTHWYSKTGDIKTNRGFYVQEPVTKIRIEVRDNFDESRSLLIPDVQYEYYDDFKENIETLKQYAVSNVQVISSDEYHFETNYETPRIVVLNIPFDKGWTLKDNQSNEEIELIMADGGFNAFIANPGNYQYVLVYETPNLFFGFKITFIGTMFVLLYYVILDSIKKYNMENRLTHLVPFKKGNHKEKESKEYDATLIFHQKGEEQEITIHKKDED